MLSIVLLRDFLECLKEGIEHNLKYYHWLSLIFIAILILGGSIFWMLQGNLRPDPRIVGFLSVIFFLVLLSTGIPIGFILATVAFLGITNIRGLEASYSILGTVLFRNTGSYAWSVFPLFVLMGYFCYYLDISKDLFDSAYKFFGRLPGGLAIATVGSCTAFGAISGDNAAGAATMGVVALPELKKYRYNIRLALGCIVGGGTLEFLIPPSIGMILYGVLAEQSIADLFIAGIVPGLICATFFSIYIYIACKRNPELGPKGPKFPIKEKIKSLKSTWPILFLFLIVIGGLYGGMFTPTEAGGVGAFMAMTIGLFMQRLTIRKLINALVETGRISAMVFIILGGAVLFGYFLTASQFTLELANFVAGLNMPPIFVVIAILLVFLILGFFMPGSAILLINIPIFLPLVKSLGFDLIWFGVLCVMMQNIGALTPPFGFVVYAVKGVAIDVPISEIFWGAVPFLIILVVMVVLTIMFPEIATWLPYALKR
jgi:tripartite ATP-independent transporter DctM subunit